MAVPGRKPKPKALVRHRNRPVHDWTEVPDVPFTEAPKLPLRTPLGQPWEPSVRRWYAAVSTMPHCVLWAGSDWEFAFDTAWCLQALHQGGTRMAAEVRAREKVLATTADARRDQRVRYYLSDDAGATETDETVTRLDDYYYRDL